MATPRKRFFVSIPEAVVLRDDLSIDQVGQVARLAGWLNHRRFRDGLTLEEASSAVLGEATRALITGNRNPYHARRSLERLADVVEMFVEHRRDVSSILWPKCAEYLGWTPPNPSERGALRIRTDLSLSQDPYVGLEGVVSGLVGVPESLAPAERQAFSRWLHTAYPPLWPERLELERRCLEHYRAPENAAAARATRSWLARCKAYAAGAWERRWKQAPLGFGPRGVRRTT